MIPAGVTGDGLAREVQAELRGLGRGLATDVGAHLAAVALFINDDPERAWGHAVAARRMAARLGVVRETAGLAAYRAGRYTDALAELRTARRMTGSNEHLPVMADSERGLGRPQRALDLIRGEEAATLGRDGLIELAIVESGARADLGQLDAAVVAVQRPELEAKDSSAVARLRFAYAEALRAVGQHEEADVWHRRALSADRDGSAGIPVVVRGDSGSAAGEYLEDDEYEDDEILDLESGDDDGADAVSEPEGELAGPPPDRYGPDEDLDADEADAELAAAILSDDVTDDVTDDVVGDVADEVAGDVRDNDEVAAGTAFSELPKHRPFSEPATDEPVADKNSGERPPLSVPVFNAPAFAEPEPDDLADLDDPDDSDDDTPAGEPS